MQPILKTIATEYSKRYNNLKNICFIFPNKRCGVFLKRYFAENGVTSEALPHILTISEFVSQIARKTEANKIVQLFTLFNSYQEISGENTSLDFDSFRVWGETVLSDFNTVDLNLAEPEEIFKNIKDYREIATNFLTEEQKEVMREYFGISEFDDSGSFWKNFEDPEKITPLQQRFLNLWQILYPLHENFIGKLKSKGLGTVGSIYREASEKIKDDGKDCLPYKKIVAVGFNALTESERSIFKTLQSLEGYPGYDDFSDFIWDATGPVLENKEFSASRFVNYNKKHFPQPDWLIPALEKQRVTDFPEIKILAAPSLTSQAKVAGEILKEYGTDVQKRMVADAEVALILPDESLLDNTLFSIPQEIGDINLTMGISFKNTPVSSFISLLARLYAGERKGKNGAIFFVKDLRLFFSHPYSYLMFPSVEIGSLMEYIDTYHKVSVNLEEIKCHLISGEELFKFPDKKGEGNEIFPYLKKVLSQIISNIEAEGGTPETNEDIARIRIYQDYLDSLEESIKEYSIKSTPLSIIRMADRIVSSEKIGFEGEPLMGLQVMGTLETRSIDFRHVIVMSMNEGIMPRKTMMSTFIPESLRKAYGLPPARYAEELFGYYFYRLISRAEKVTLIYDARANSGMRGGESRYLLQLRQYCPKENLTEEAWQYKLQNRETEDASIEKTPEILEKIEAFSATGKDAMNLSASSLDTYRQCQVNFLLKNVLNIDSDPDKGEYLDAITVGKVLHKVMMDLYLPADKQCRLLKDPVVITKDMLESIIENKALIHTLVKKNIRELYYKIKEEGREVPTSGVNDIIAEQITELVTEIIRHDISIAPFNLYGCEVSETIKVRLKSGREVNFRFSIDRLDEVEYKGENRIRIIDYKTGKRKRKAESLEEIFEGGSESSQIFQLFMYAWLLGKTGFQGWKDVLTEIYYVPDMVKETDGLPEIGKEKVETLHPYIDEFSDRLENMIEEIFISPMFKETGNNLKCRNCAFAALCGK